ncbi:hypothetical protein JTE90_008102 [Oedothorax gibbosus]|uniref:RNase NYN domain-containing protein n=1 Tax=Oedothorax gibbosus TaxID=931172 RepID=A0AAV6V1U3_9ARAC|nr:hypothetical protein JTE90_008102 [Oedothorax gibbosus]
MEVFTLSLEQFRYIRKHRKNLEVRFHLKIILPEEYNLTCTIANVSGEKRNIQELKDLLTAKDEENNKNTSTSNDIPLIILSDSDSETEVQFETPIKKKKRKNKFETFDSLTSQAAGKLTTPGNSSEVRVLDVTTSPPSKRARTGPAFPSEEYIPLSVTKNIEGARSVKIKPKKKSSRNAKNHQKANLSSTSAISVASNTSETDVNSTQDESVRLIEDTFVLDCKPSSSSTNSSESEATLTLDDSVTVLDDSARVTDDSIRIIEDCFVLDKTPSLPKENNTIALDDSIVEITMPEDQNRFTFRSNPILTEVFPIPSNYRNRTATNHFPRLARVFNNRNNLVSLNSSSVQQPLWAEQPLIANQDQITNALQNVLSGSNLVISNGLVSQVPRPMTVKLRPVVIDGSNVARDHGLATNTYSCKGIKISVDYFLRRGHTEITVFIPKFRKHRILGPIPTTDPIILDELEKAGMLSYSPSRTIDGLRQSCYDDRFVVQLATQNGGVIVSNDNFRDIMGESEDYKKTIKERLLMFCFAGDVIMFPEDPLGRGGPRLKDFLAFPPE